MDNSLSNPKPFIIRSHYRICMRPVMTGPGTTYNGIKFPPVRTPPDMVFNTATLARLCVEALIKSGRCSSSLIPAHIKEFIKEISSSKFVGSSARPTDPTALKELNLQVGNFGEYARILDQPNPYCFSTDLVHHAKTVLKYECAS